MADRPQDPAATPPATDAASTPAPGRRPVIALDPPMVPFTLAGTGVWAVAGVLLLITDAPAAWRWTCLAGVLIGIALTVVVWLRDRFRARRAGYRPTRASPGGTSTSSTSLSS